MTLRVQLLPAARLAEQLLDTVKLLAFIPLTEILEISNDPLPVLEIDTVRAREDVPDVMEPNDTEDDDTSADGEGSMGMPAMEPHPELKVTINVNIAVDINLEKQLCCMIGLPRYPEVLNRPTKRKFQSGRKIWMCSTRIGDLSIQRALSY